ncbi:MAG: hypothetical protein KDC07_00980 [Chitinophagaceae bacterium]|nr:hypothetical protein [Chitinophagaceae bacterium]MCB9045815.1 hypothetical protein [Chitinophagales bacterium]
MTTKHLQFCLNYLQTHDPGVAYKMTYPKASTNSLYAAASRLMARPDVSAWIEETERSMHQRVLRQIEEEQGEVLKKDLLTINQKRAVLSKIITGETKRRRNIKTKYGYTVVEDDLPVYAVLRAIDMDTRLENFYNYLTNSHTWRKTHNLYVNTPTLQQQVNILIAQTTEKEKEPIQEIDIPVEPAPVFSPSGGRDRQQPVEAGTPAKGNTEYNLSPAGGGGTLATNNSPERHTLCLPFRGIGGQPPTPNNSPLGRACPPTVGGVGVGTLARGNTPYKKTPRYLTSLNNFSPQKQQTSGTHDNNSPTQTLCKQ